MPIRTCKICPNEFYVKPSHDEKGWGVFCSRVCKHLGTQKRKILNCFVCAKIIHKTLSQMRRSKSQKFFCGKSCQTKWRNVEFSGERHLGWKGGQSLYCKILLESHIQIKCIMCSKKDLRILAVHHIDENRSNSSLNNLMWLCHNCHYLVHHDKLEKQRFDDILKS
jgi:5-methylcytosine-specific restriction endonuclease McrA